MSKIKNAQKRLPFRFEFQSLRNLTSPEDLLNDRKTYAGQTLLTSILKIPTNENVRDYLKDGEGKLRKTYTSVHRSIRSTLINDPGSFNVLNSGVVIVAKDIFIDEKEKFLQLYEPSIINGAQTQGVINDLFSDKILPENVHIKYEIVVTDDDELIAEISIARNFQNNVLAVSIAGRLGQFDDLEKSVQRLFPYSTLRKSESEYPNQDINEIIDTEKLLQVITALIPQVLWYRSESEDPNKVYTYSMKARCLKEFQEIIKKSKESEDSNEKEKFANLYQYYIDIAPYAWELYLKWKIHQGFAGTGLRSIERDESEIIDVPDGIIFPIISSLSVFAEKKKGLWKLNIPADKIDKILIGTAKRVYMEIAKSNPQSMGKSKACYGSLLEITSLYKDLIG